MLAPSVMPSKPRHVYAECLDICCFVVLLNATCFVVAVALRVYALKIYLDHKADC